MGRSSKSKHPRHTKGRFVQLPEWILKTEAWRNLSLPSRCLYIELKRRYVGNNNGSIKLSYRECENLLGLHRNSIGQRFVELQKMGFITKTSEPYLGPSGIGQTANWLLEEYVDDRTGHPAGKRFMTIKNENPAQN